ncbi:hypothetical protein [Hafnia paralvei]|uniref:hypothetical protein n=1 Tax=Hafnia paralvei TaxID=546367 RepID=UPI00103463B4|nr:hypothetical protein [Hafnia paralvei]TBL56449.1 hypothetical protein EYY97_21745 [Hafnia paralvei]
MKAFFDGSGNLVIDPEDNTEWVALHLWTYINADSEQTIRELLNDETFALCTCFGDYGNANSNAVSVTKSELE